MLNDSSTRDFDLLVVTDPSILDINGEPVVHQHVHWRVVTPTLTRDDSVCRSYRSLTYVNKGRIASKSTFSRHVSRRGF